MYEVIIVRDRRRRQPVYYVLEAELDRHRQATNAIRRSHGPFPRDIAEIVAMNIADAGSR